MDYATMRRDCERGDIRRMFSKAKKDEETDTYNKALLNCITE